MKPRKLKEGIYWVGAIDWNRRLFDALIPLPEGTSYNSYLIQGSEKTVLIDTIDPTMKEQLFDHLDHFPQIDYVVSNHSEQDHSGLLPHVLERYSKAKILASPKARPILKDLLHIPEDCIIDVENGQTVSLGNKTLEFIHLPWVHWPETMGTYLQEDEILFSCDFFGSHLATSELYAEESPRVYEAAKRYYAEIMMPYSKAIKGNLEKLSSYEISLIAPSHGPLYENPAFIIDAYHEWVSGDPKNLVIIPYATMHFSTQQMVNHLIGGLIERGISVEPFNLDSTDLGRLATTLVDAATIVIGTPAVMTGPHPNVVYAVYLANALKPKTKFASIIGSFGWSSKVTEHIAQMTQQLKVEMLDPVYCKGKPKKEDFDNLDKLADAILEKHKQIGLI